MIRFGLIGYPLSHSFSQGYFTRKFQEEGTQDRYRYDNFPLASIQDFPTMLAQHPDLRGINVTIPYKEAVIPFLDALDPAAAAIGAVNTIRIDQGKLTGYNTDVIGFGESLHDFLAHHGGPSQGALVLGTGGAAKGVAWVLRQAGIPFTYVSRTKSKEQLSYSQPTAAHLAKVDLIVNTTPLGMSPAVDNFPDIPYHCLNARHRLYDVIYNPPKTVFLQKGEAQGAAIRNGLAMLHGQAEAAWTIWRQTN